MPSITTEDGRRVEPGDRVFNYYDCKWGTIRAGSLDVDGWFYVDHEDGSHALLNGARIASYEPKWSHRV